jgi:hypothetical protein
MIGNLVNTARMACYKRYREHEHEHKHEHVATLRGWVQS